MAYFDSFMRYTPTLREEWETHTQEFLNEEFENSPNVITIGEEKVFGTLEFTPTVCRIMSTLDSKVGDKINDDFRTLFFPNIDYHPCLGQRFKFFDNIWIVYNTDNVNSLNSGCYVRRCNNTINSLDYYGNIHEEPCVIDIKPTKSSFIEREEMWSPTARQIIFYQKNKWTENLGYNSRIMYEGQTYRIGVNLNFDRTSTFDKNSVKFIRAYLDYDLVNEYDNTELQIANYHKPDFSIQVPEKLEMGLTQTGFIPFTVSLGEQDIEEKVYWYSENEEIIKINKFTGEYNTVSEGETFIKVCLQGNEEYFSKIKIVVSDNPINISEIKITPEDYYIPLNQSKTYEVYEVVNGVKQDTAFDFNFLNLSSKYYKATTTANSFTIKNLKMSDNILLKVVIINRNTLESSDIYIELGGLF